MWNYSKVIENAKFTLENGMLKGVNYEAEDRSKEIAMKTISTIGKIGLASSTGGAGSAFFAAGAIVSGGETESSVADKAADFGILSAVCSDGSRNAVAERNFLVAKLALLRADRRTYLDKLNGLYKARAAALRGNNTKDETTVEVTNLVDSENIKVLERQLLVLETRFDCTICKEGEDLEKISEQITRIKIKIKELQSEERAVKKKPENDFKISVAVLKAEILGVDSEMKGLEADLAKVLAENLTVVIESKHLFERISVLPDPRIIKLKAFISAYEAKPDQKSEEETALKLIDELAQELKNASSDIHFNPEPMLKWFKKYPNMVKRGAEMMKVVANIDCSASPTPTYSNFDADEDGVFYRVPKACGVSVQHSQYGLLYNDKLDFMQFGRLANIRMQNGTGQDNEFVLNFDEEGNVVDFQLIEHASAAEALANVAEAAATEYEGYEGKKLDRQLGLQKKETELMDEEKKFFTARLEWLEEKEKMEEKIKEIEAEGTPE